MVCFGPCAPVESQPGFIVLCFGPLRSLTNIDYTITDVCLGQLVLLVFFLLQKHHDGIEVSTVLYVKGTPDEKICCAF